MTEDFFRMAGYIALICFIVWVLSKSLRLHHQVVEGLSMGSSDVAVPPTGGSSSSPAGIAGSAVGFADALKLASVKQQDSLLISKYRADYENVLITMDEFINTTMLNMVLSVDSAGAGSAANMTIFNNLNTLNTAKASLNTVMRFVDAS